MQEQTRTLLRACFPSYPDRNYFKLPPHMRYVATLGEMLVAQVGVEHRVIRIGDVVVNAFGIVDLCVNEDHRSCGIATSLLTEISTYAQDCGIDFIVLFADRHDLYLRSGWVCAGNRCSWVKVDDHRVLGVSTEISLADCMMVKSIGNLAWSTEDVELLGHVF